MKLGKGKSSPDYMSTNKYVRPRNTRTEMYAGGLSCCSLVSHFQYTPRSLLRLEKWDRGTGGQTDGHQTVTLCLPLDAASVMMGPYWRFATVNAHRNCNRPRTIQWRRDRGRAGREREIDSDAVMNISNFFEHYGDVLDDRPQRTVENRRPGENGIFSSI